MKRNLYFLVVFALLLNVFLVAGCKKPSMIVDDKSVDKKTAVESGVEGAKSPDELKASGESAIKEADAAKAGSEENAAASALKEAREKAATEPYTGSYEFKDINFDFDEFSLREDAREILKKHAKYLDKNDNLLVVVQGHCDERGTTEYNLALGERRANAAAKFLIDMGIDAKRIKTTSYGEEMPLDPNHNEDAWAKNRRVHFEVTGKK